MIQKDKWLQAVDHASAEYHKAFDALGAEALNWKPSETQWSVGQCIHHITTTNRQYFPIFSKVMNGTYKTPLMGRLPGTPTLFGNMIFKSLHENRSKKYKTFPVFEPTKSDVSSTVLSEFDDVQNQLKELVQKLSDRQLRQIIASPVSQIVVYRVERALDIICTHEMRHFHQAQEVNTLRLGN